MRTVRGRCRDELGGRRVSQIASEFLTPRPAPVAGDGQSSWRSDRKIGTCLDNVAIVTKLVIKAGILIRR